MTDETKRKYIPTGTGLCGRADCGHDVGGHYGGHEFMENRDGWCMCLAHESDTIHDVGRVLRCPEEAAHD